MKKMFLNYIENLQDQITQSLEKTDSGGRFDEEIWNRPGGGGGKSRIIQDGNIIEKGGVNISDVFGHLPGSMQEYLKVPYTKFSACGLSLVLHPRNPFIPTVHANWRYFEMYDSDGEVADQWFGGGMDLTPYYLFDEDAVHFHRVCKVVCDRHGETLYPLYKKQCDEYFFNTHRGEARGIGGLFFDRLRPDPDKTVAEWFDFVTDTGDQFLEAYLPIVERRKENEYNSEHRKWQEIRRGRYVEFNLIHDKGTLFGLKTDGRIESILMSLPPVVQWIYDYHPSPGSAEAALIEVLKQPRKWA